MEVDLAVSEALIKQTYQWRHDLHRVPEPSGQEFETAKRIASYFKSFSNYKILEKIGGNGVLVEVASKRPGPTILFRAELDGLPIIERNQINYASKHAGLSHKCGHDGHMAILLGLGKYMTQHPPPGGKVLLLFQPAEETGQGAKAILEAPKFKKFQPDYVFALHNLPGYPKHQIVIRSGSFNAAVRSVVFRMFGETSHAAEPEKGINPASAIAHIIKKIELCSNRAPAHPNFSILTPVYIQMGKKAYGISAGQGEIHYTLRTWDENAMDRLVETILKEVKNISSEHGLKLKVEWTDTFSSCKNHPEATRIIQEAADYLHLNILNPGYPFRWGEDFGYFTHRFKGAMFGLGAGVDSLPLHHPDYDFRDELIKTGLQMYIMIIRKLNK